MEKIGEGSYGVVYRAVSKDDGIPYAIKIFKNKVYNEANWKKYMREIRNHESVPPHDNIVKLFRSWEEKFSIHMQLEWCEETLDCFGVRNYPISEEVLWQIVLDVVLGLKHLHDNNFLHLDIKLENVMRGRDGLWKIGDFSLLTDLSEGPLNDAIEGDNRYLPPEFLKFGAISLTKAADIFSLGIAFLELALNIKLPYSGEIWCELREGILPPSSSNVPEDLYNLIKKMMNPDYTKRPTVDAILQTAQLRKLLVQQTPEILPSVRAELLPSLSIEILGSRSNRITPFGPSTARKRHISVKNLLKSFENAQ